MPKKSIPGLIAMILAVVITLIASPRVPAQADDLYDLAKVRTFHLTFHQPDWWAQLVANKEKEIDISADLTVGTVSVRNIGVRFKGNSSYRGANTDKNPFNLSIDSFVASQRLLGYRTVNLNNSFKDPTFVREVIAYQIYRRYLPAPKAVFVRLYINNVYWGVYINVQQPNTDFLDEAYGEDEGNNFKGEAPDLGVPAAKGGNSLQWLGTSKAAYQQNYELKSGDETKAWDNLIGMIDKLNNTSATSLPVELPKVLNVDRALWYLALTNILANMDSYLGSGKNYHIYQDGVHGLFNMIPWDVNEAFGTNSGGLTPQQLKELSPFYKETSVLDRPLIGKLLGVPAWREQYVAHCRTILAESFNWTVIGPMVTKYQGLIDSYVKADTKNLFTYAQFLEGATRDINNGKQIIPGLKSFIQARSAWLQGEPSIRRSVPAITGVKLEPVKPVAGKQTWVQAQVTSVQGISRVDLAYAMKGEFTTVAMADDGLHHDGKANDGVYGASIPAAPVATTVRYYLRASATGGGMTLEPPRAEHVTYHFTIEPVIAVGPVRIHEFMAKNETVIKDEKGEFEDWIELLNTGPTTVDLSGYHLTDKADQPTKWTFPLGTTILPGKTLLVWADEDAGDGPLHANFKLDADGERIQLFSPDGTTRYDQVEFGVQPADLSCGRAPGVSDYWFSFPQATPDTPNRPGPGAALDFGTSGRAREAIGINGQGLAKVGGQIGFRIHSAPAGQAGLLLLGVAPGFLSIGVYGNLLLDATQLFALPLTTDANGVSNSGLPIPNVPAFAGAVITSQAFVHDGKTGGFSNGVMTAIAP